MLIYDLTFEKLQEFMVNNNQKKFRASQVWDWLYVKNVSSFSEMKNLPKETIEFLENNFILDSLELVTHHTSNDGTIKYLFGLPDRHLIETVLMTHNYGKSICVTTQVGCNIGCTFCASGVIKKKRDLTCGEIVGQIVKAQRLANEKITSVVVMGIGEPFDNYKNLLEFLDIINDPKGLAIGKRHITVSTSGLVPKIKEFADLNTQFNLALSLHAPNNEIRSSLMKINKAYPIEELIQAIRYYILKTNRRVTIEYILINEINDSIENARELANLLKGLNVYVNLIPYNEVKEAPYIRSKVERRNAFYDILKKHNINVTLRKEQGHDINAACGQLRTQHLSKEN